MSTRATYQFQGETIYIHYDGYPEGAARYFRAMLEKMNEVEKLNRFVNRGGYYFNFIRANPLAEPTECHKSHGDTEYQYTLDNDGSLLAMGRSPGSDSWSTVFCGRLSDFINKYDPADKYNHRDVVMEFEGKPILVKWLNEIYKDQLRTLGQWSLNELRGANYDGLKKSVSQLQDALKPYSFGL